MALLEHIWGCLRKKLFIPFCLPACLYVSLEICFTRDNAATSTVAVIICWHQSTSSFTSQSGLKISGFTETFPGLRYQIDSEQFLSSQLLQTIVGLPRLYHVSQSNKFIFNISVLYGLSYSRDPWLLVSLLTLFFETRVHYIPKKTWIIFLFSQPPKCWECRHVPSHLAEAHF